MIFKVVCIVCKALYKCCAFFTSVSRVTISDTVVNTQTHTRQTALDSHTISSASWATNQTLITVLTMFSLLTRQHNATFTDKCVKSIWKLTDEDISVCHPRCLPHLFIARRYCIYDAVVNVLRNCWRKQCRLLRANKNKVYFQTSITNTNTATYWLYKTLNMLNNKHLDDYMPFTVCIV